MTRTPEDLQTFMDQHQIPGEIIHLTEPTPTVPTAAAAVGAQVNQIVKSVLFLIHGEPVLAVACGISHIDRRKIARHMGVGRKRVKLGNAETVLEFTGYAPGAVPPFGHPAPLNTLLDPSVLAQTEVYAGGGSGHALVRLNPQDILRTTNAIVLPLLEA